MSFKTVLCPIDYSSASKSALETAAKLARKHDAALHILHVYELLFVDGYIDGMAQMPVSPDIEGLKRRLTSVRPLGIEVTHDLVFGIPASSIVNYANANNIDLIVMGTRSTSGFGRWLLGSVTESVMRAAPCPVLTVHDKAAMEKEKKSDAEAGMTFVW